MREIVKRIEDARCSGLDVAADTYAYTASFNSFSATVPPWVHEGGDTSFSPRISCQPRTATKFCRTESKKGWLAGTLPRIPMPR